MYKTPNKKLVFPNRWFDKECKNVKFELKDLLNKCKKNQFKQEFVIKYLNKKKDYTKLLTNKENNYRDSLLNDLTNAKDSKRFWEIINSMQFKGARVDAIDLETWGNVLRSLYPPIKLNAYSILNNNTVELG